MSIYAKNTSVSSEKSRGEIENTLARYGASAFVYATNNNKAMIQFQAHARRIMFVLQLPDKTEKRFTHTRGGKGYQKWTDEIAYELWEQACRQKWRCLALAVKAKLESVESGISTFEDEFLAHIVMPDGKTVSQHTKNLIEDAYQTGKMVPLLPHFGEIK